MSAAASMLIPGSGMVQNVIEKMSDQIVAMVDEILTEKADAMMYEIIQPKIEDCLKAIFESYPVQLEASKMFNREIFPIYKSTLDDFANFNAITQSANGEIDKALENYANNIILNQNNNNEKLKAKQTLISELKKISNSNVGDALTMKGGDIGSFLGNDENKFKQMDGGKSPQTYLSSNTKKISDAIEEIVGKTKKDYDDKRENIKQSEEDFSLFKKKRRENMRIPGISACKNLDDMKKTEESMKDINNAVQLNQINELKETKKNLGMSGGKRRQRKNRKHTLKKRKN